MNSKLIVSVIIIIVLSLLIWKGLSMRRNLPFQEFVPVDKGVAVVNAGDWYKDKIKISLLKDGSSIQTKQYDNKGFCLFDNLSNGTQYNVEIRRNDIKGKLLYKKIKAEVAPIEGGSKYVVLVGASVGKAWEFQELSERFDIDKRIITGNRAIYDFDKSKAINTLCSLPIPVTAVIIKECAAYFPREINGSREQIISWVSQLRDKGVQPILATVVPVTKDHDVTHQGRFKSIIEYNDFVREYAAYQGIPLLDLEKVLRISDEDGHLNIEYAQPDGLHLIKKGYQELDKIMPTLFDYIK